MLLLDRKVSADLEEIYNVVSAKTKKTRIPKAA